MSKPANPYAIPGLPERQEGPTTNAFDHVHRTENDLDRLRSLIRMFFILDLNDMMPDNRDVMTVMEIGIIMEEALDRICAARDEALGELHPLVYPHRHETGRAAA